MSAAPLSANPVTFPNGNQASLLRAAPKTSPAEILQELGIAPAPGVIILCGSTAALDSRLDNRLKELLSRGAARAAVETGALIIDGGTQAGVIELMGMGVADRGRQTTLVGVAPDGKVSYPGMPAPEGETSRTALDPNHSHFVLVESDHWGGETEMMFDLAKVAAAKGAPVLTILAGGSVDGVALNEALASVRHGWPLLILEGSDRLADRIAGLQKQKQAIEKRTSRLWKFLGSLPGLRGLTVFSVDNSLYSEIVHDGQIILFPRHGDADQLRALLNSQIAPPPSQRDDLLNLAWRRFADYDLNSLRHRNNWYKLKNIPLYLGVISTLLVLIYSANTVQLTAPEATDLWGKGYSAFMAWMTGIRDIPVLDLLFRLSIISLPISTSVIMGIETRFKLGSKYILLRGAAEAIKRGIYSFRALASVDCATSQLPNDQQSLSKHMESVSKLLLESDVNEAAFKPYTGPIPPSMYGAEAYDDGRSPLKPAEYVRIRIGDQIKFFTLRTNQYEKRLRTLRVWILVLGGVGTLLAALEAQYWLPFTAAIVTAMTAFLEYRQIEPILVKYNLTKSSLENLNSWWESLSSPEQKNDENIYNLVREVEAILESENQGWVQYVKQAQETEKMTSPEQTAIEQPESQPQEDYLPNIPQEQSD